MSIYLWGATNCGCAAGNNQLQSTTTNLRPSMSNWIWLGTICGQLRMSTWELWVTIDENTLELRLGKKECPGETCAHMRPICNRMCPTAHDWVPYQLYRPATNLCITGENLHIIVHICEVRTTAAECLDLCSSASNWEWLGTICDMWQCGWKNGNGDKTGHSKLNKWDR